jgi:hypothetical protein
MSPQTEEFLNNVTGFLNCKFAVEATAKVACVLSFVRWPLLMTDLLEGLLAAQVHGRDQVLQEGRPVVSAEYVRSSMRQLG